MKDFATFSSIDSFMLGLVKKWLMLTEIIFIFDILMEKK